MYNLICADLYKLRKSLAIKFLLAITTISAITVAVAAYLIPQGKIAVSTNGIWFMFGDMNIMSILGAVIAGIFICGDFDNKTIHDAIASGYSRCTVIISKAVSFWIAIGLILLPYAMVTLIAICTGNKFSMGSIDIGFLHLITTGAGTAISASGIVNLLIVLLTLTIVYMAQLSICIPIAILSKKPVLVVAIYYGLTILLASLTGLKNSSAAFDHIFACTPYGGKYSFLTLNTQGGYIFQAIFVSALYMLIMLVITYFVFRKSEIK